MNSILASPPYVYKGIHRKTNQVYFGARCKNKKVPEIDLPIYKTSSKIVKQNFDDFDWEIIFVGFDNKIVFEVEANFIIEFWKENKKLSLNRYANRKFNNSGRLTSNEVKQKISNSLQGRSVSQETRNKLSKASKGKSKSLQHKQNLAKKLKQVKSTVESRKINSESHLGQQVSEETRKKISKAQLGSKRSESAKEKMSQASKGKPKSELHKANISKSRRGITFNKRCSCLYCKKEMPTNILFGIHKSKCVNTIR